MPKYEVYATRWDNPHIVDELIPARGLEFSMPLSDHGEASFTATAEPGRSFWRPSIALPMSGVLITRDGVPYWDGWVTSEQPAGARSFQFTAKEWGYFFEKKVTPVARTWSWTNDHQIFRDLITDAQAISGQNAQITMDTTTMGQSFSDRTINEWDDTTVGREFRSVSNAKGGPEWYFGSTGTLASPVRRLFLGDYLGHLTPQTTLEYVEDTVDYQAPSPPPVVTLLGGMYPGPAPLVPTRRAGGNLIAQSRTRSVDDAVTAVKVTGSGTDLAKLLAHPASATNLIAAGWPKMTKTVPFPDVKIPATLERYASAQLRKAAGISTGYKLVSLDDDPDWTQTPRGSIVQVILDTDIYGADRPLGGAGGFNARLLNTVVRVSDNGAAQVEWQVADVQEVQ